MKNIILAVTVVLFAGVAQAREYGTAGCGLGNLAFGKSSQVFAATTNGTGLQTVGITLGTSNCTDSNSHASLRLPLFIETNRIALANDVARGNGDALKNLSGILGCRADNGVGARLKSKYQAIFPADANSERVSLSILDAVRSDARLAKECKNLT